MQDYSKQIHVLDEDLRFEKIRQVGIQIFYALFVQRDLDTALTNIGESVKWNGSEEYFVAHNKQELHDLLEKRLKTIPQNSEMKVERVECFALTNDCYCVTGELALRMPFEKDIQYMNLRFMMSGVINRDGVSISSVQSSVTQNTQVKKEQMLSDGQYKEMVYDITHQENHDLLTGLFTLDYFKETLKLFLQHTKEGSQYALLYTDITNFEKLNNLYGLQKADEVLLSISQLLTSIEKNVIYCCRSVADHFLLLVEFSSQSMLKQFARSLCDRFDKTIKGKFPDAALKLGVGIFVINDFTLSVDKMVERANVARKSLRFPASNRVAFYDQKVFHHVEQIKRIEKNMQKALDDGEFKVFLQPKYSLITGEVTGSEALARWIRPDGTMIYPDEFIPVFEKNGFIEKIDFYMLEQVCIMMSRRRKAKKKCLPVSINQSRVLLKKRDYTTHIAKILLKYQTPPQLIELELTERLFSDQYGDMFSMMEQLKKVGIRWSIDDFGTGYSSLNLLKELPVDIIKLDKSFLDETETSEVSRVIIRKIIELTKELQKSVICEGVETRAQADYLKEVNCDMAQGFLYARPMPMAEYEELIDSKTGGKQ